MVEHTITRRGALATATSIGAMTFAGCIGDDGDDDMEGEEVVIYNPAGLDPVARHFERETGILVDDRMLPGPQALARFTSEHEAGDYQADLVWGAIGIMAWEETTQFLEPYEAPAGTDLYTHGAQEQLEEQGVEVEDGESLIWPTIENYRTTLYNVDNVDDPPVEWEDLLDPQWEGDMTTNTHQMPRIYTSLLLCGWDEDDVEDYIVDLDAQVDEYGGGGVGDVMAVVAGRTSLNVASFANQAQDELASGIVDVTVPSCTTTHPSGVGMSKEAPHPEPALELAQYLTSKEGHEAIAEERGYNPTHPDVPHGTPEVQEAIDEADPELHAVMYTPDWADYVRGQTDDLVGVS